jgi:pimeloyl-ACP methyl ester carboxylesterase
VPRAEERWRLPLDQPGEAETFHRVAAERCARLRDHWLERGVDIGAYTAVESADDVDLLRRALGADRLRLVGASYGSHLAFAVLRRHGASIDRALLALVEGPDHTHKLPGSVQAALAHYAALARDEPALDGAVPDLLGLVGELLDRLENRPIVIDVGATRVVAGRYDLQRAIASGVGDQDAIRALPARLLALRAGDRAWLGRFVLDDRRRWIASATYWHTDAASGASTERRRRIAEEARTTLLGDVINHPFPLIESVWGNPDLGDGFRSPVRTSVPVQFQSGALDGRTPPSNVDDVRDGFVNAGHLVIDGVAHDEAYVIPEVAIAATRFLAGGDPIDARIVAPFTFAAPSARS